MAQPITWRNVNAQNQSAAVAFNRQGNDSLNRGLQQLSGVAQDFGDTRRDVFNKEQQVNTQDALTAIGGLDQAGIDSFQNPTGNVNENALIQALRDRQGQINTNTQQSVDRAHLLQQRANKATDRTNKINEQERVKGIADSVGLAVNNSLELGSDFQTGAKDVAAMVGNAGGSIQDINDAVGQYQQSYDRANQKLSAGEQVIKDKQLKRQDDLDKFNISLLERDDANFKKANPTNQRLSVEAENAKWAETYNGISKQAENGWFDDDGKQATDALNTIREQVNGVTPQMAQTALSASFDSDGEFIGDDEFRKLIANLLQDNTNTDRLIQNAKSQRTIDTARRNLLSKEVR